MIQNELDDARLLVANFPEVGTRARSRRIENARIVELRRSRYRLYDQVLPLTHEIYVVHVRHGIRRPPRARKE